MAFDNGGCMPPDNFNSIFPQRFLEAFKILKGTLHLQQAINVYFHCVASMPFSPDILYTIEPCIG